MVQKIINVFFYAGVDSNSYEEIRPRVRETNRMMTTILSFFATILILMMYIASFKTASVHQNKIVYMAGFIISVFICVLSVTLAKKVPKITMFLVYISYAIYYMYGILIGTVTDPSGKTVTFIVMLVFLPTLFVDRPINIIGTTVTYALIFIGLCLITKDESVMSVDIIDAAIFGALGAACGSVMTSIKVRGYVSEKRLEEISRIDQLTQVRNRNAYELERSAIPSKCRYAIGCIYIDVNGLHELNNAKGHESGDIMLKFVAEQIKSHFDEQFVYRIGGDEFVAFAVDPEEKDLKCALQILVENVEKEGYHIASGVNVARIYHLSLETLIKNTEEKMTEDKYRYYKNIAYREMRARG